MVSLLGRESPEDFELRADEIRQRERDVGYTSNGHHGRALGEPRKVAAFE